MDRRIVSRTGASSSAPPRVGSAVEHRRDVWPQGAEGRAPVADRVLLRGGELTVGAAVTGGDRHEVRVVAEAVGTAGFVDHVTLHRATHDVLPTVGHDDRGR